ncbi:MAG: hypothetical protein V1778_00880 [bacterium]
MWKILLCPVLGVGILRAYPVSIIVIIGVGALSAVVFGSLVAGAVGVGICLFAYGAASMVSDALAPSGEDEDESLWAMRSPSSDRQ